MVNKKQLILIEAKRLFGRYGYLGFTLKQLAEACQMTSPALYYFYSSKAELFKDCIISEMVSRRDVLERCVEQSDTLEEFAHLLAYGAVEVCDRAAFRAGMAMREIVHLPDAMQEEICAEWEACLIEPVESFVDRVFAGQNIPIPHRLLAVYLINMATFSANNGSEYSHNDLAALFVTVVSGLSQPVTQP